jgi:hypothetical protein
MATDFEWERWPLFGAAIGAGVGCAVGLVVGLIVYPPTAWAATFEIGIPSTVVGMAVGGVAAGARLLWILAFHRPPPDEAPG